MRDSGVWMSMREELAQGIKGHWSHLLLGDLAVLSAHLFEAPIWAACLSVAAAGLIWELGMCYLTRPGHFFWRFTQRTWKASVLGMLSFWVGAAAGAVTAILAAARAGGGG